MTSEGGKGTHEQVHRSIWSGTIEQVSTELGLNMGKERTQESAPSYFKGNVL